MKMRAVIDIGELDREDSRRVYDLVSGIFEPAYNNTYYVFDAEDFEEPDDSFSKEYYELGNILRKYAEGEDNFILLYWW